MFFKKSDSVSLEKSSDDASIRKLKKSKIIIFFILSFIKFIAKLGHVSSFDSVFEKWQNIIDMQDYIAEHYREFSYKSFVIFLLEFYDSECGKESALFDNFDWDFPNIDPKEILLSEDFKHFEEDLATKSMFTGVRLCDICKEVLTGPESISQSDQTNNHERLFQIQIDILRHPLVFTDRIFAIICRQCNSEIYALVDEVYTDYPEYKKGFTNALEYLETLDVDEEEMDDMIGNYRFRLDGDFSYKLLNPQLCSHYEEDQCYNGIFLDTQKIMTKKQISTSDWLPEYDELIQLYNSEINTHICTLFDWLCTNNYLEKSLLNFYHFIFRTTSMLPFGKTLDEIFGYKVDIEFISWGHQRPTDKEDLYCFIDHIWGHTDQNNVYEAKKISIGDKKFRFVKMKKVFSLDSSKVNNGFDDKLINNRSYRHASNEIFRISNEFARDIFVCHQKCEDEIYKRLNHSRKKQPQLV